MLRGGENWRLCLRCIDVFFSYGVLMLMNIYVLCKNHQQNILATLTFHNACCHIAHCQKPTQSKLILYKITLWKIDNLNKWCANVLLLKPLVTRLFTGSHLLSDMAITLLYQKLDMQILVFCSQCSVVSKLVYSVNDIPIWLSTLNVILMCMPQQLLLNSY